MDIAGQRGEFLVLEYLDGDRVYVPVQSLHLITRYTGAAPESAPLHKLGTDQWAKARRRAAEQIRDVAAELLDLYARRRARPGLKIPVPELEYQSFANAFPFEETDDQAEAIRQVLSDLESSRPMDRIICAAMWATERRRSRCAQPSSRCRLADRSRCSCRPPSSPSSTSPTSKIASPTGRYASRHCHASDPDARPRRRLMRSTKARSTSSSRPIACCTRTRALGIWALSSSMKNTALEYATRNACRSLKAR